MTFIAIEYIEQLLFNLLPLQLESQLFEKLFFIYLFLYVDVTIFSLLFYKRPQDTYLFLTVSFKVKGEGFA